MENLKAKELRFKEKVYCIIGAAIDVHRELGPGFLEPVYQEALERELSPRSIPFEAQMRLTICYKGQPLNKEYIADLVCYGIAVVEIKAIDQLSGKEEARVINYLKVTGLPLGLLINFGSHGKLEWRRFVN